MGKFSAKEHKEHRAAGRQERAQNKFTWGKAGKHGERRESLGNGRMECWKNGIVGTCPQPSAAFRRLPAVTILNFDYPTGEIFALMGGMRRMGKSFSASLLPGVPPTCF